MTKSKFKVGDKVYIEKLGIEVYIQDLVKSTSGNIKYYTSHDVEIIHDKDSNKSYLDSVNEKTMFDEEDRLLLENLNLIDNKN